MGLQDRDYMHRDRDSRPRPHRRYAFRSLLWALCGSMFVAVVLMRMNDWWIARQQADAPTGGQGTWPAAPQAAPPVQVPVEGSGAVLKDGAAVRALPRPAVEAPPISARPQRQTQLVYKCVVNGRVTYSGPDECKGGLASTLEIVPAPDPGNRQSARGATQPNASQIADPPGAQRFQTPADDAAQAAATAQAQQLVASRRAECQQLDDVVRKLDSQARQPSSGQTQDWIRNQRTDARSRQFALHC